MTLTRLVALGLLCAGGLMAAVLPGPALAEWALLIESDDVNWYVDETLTRKRGTMAKVWSLQDYLTPQPLYGGEYQSVKMQAEIRCHSNEWRVFYFTYHSGRMGTGETIYSQETAGAWKKVVAGDYSEALFNTGCHPEPD